MLLVLEAQKSKIKTPAGLMSGEGSLYGMWIVISLQSPHEAGRQTISLCLCVQVLSSCPYWRYIMRALLSGQLFPEESTSKYNYGFNI